MREQLPIFESRPTAHVVVHEHAVELSRGVPRIHADAAILRSDSKHDASVRVFVPIEMHASGVSTGLVVPPRVRRHERPSSIARDSHVPDPTAVIEPLEKPMRGDVEQQHSVAELVRNERKQQFRRRPFHGYRMQLCGACYELR